MSPYTWVRWVSVGLLAVAGCGKADTGSGPVMRVTSEGSTEHAAVELFDPVARVEGEIVQLEINYRFTKGKPANYYLLEIRFPGTVNAGVKQMDGWELQEEGVIRDGFYIDAFPISDFEIELKEAFVIQDGYERISNVVTGTVEGGNPQASETAEAE